MRTRVTNSRMQHFDQQVSLDEMDQALEKAGTCETHVVAAYATVAAYRGSVGLGGNYPAFLDKLQASGTPVALIALGNPYLLRAFRGSARIWPPSARSALGDCGGQGNSWSDLYARTFARQHSGTRQIRRLG